MQQGILKWLDFVRVQKFSHLATNPIHIKKWRRFWDSLGTVVTALTLCFLIGLVLPLTAPAERCCECHLDSYEKGLGERYIHKPFLEKQCPVCHIDEEKMDEENSIETEGLSNLPKNIEWIGQNFSASTEHLFIFPQSLVKDPLFVEVWYGTTLLSRQKVHLPPLKDLPQKPNPKSPPKIFEVKVLELRQDKLAFARITWKTEEFSTSLVSFGLDDLDLTSRLDTFLSKGHEVVLSRLKPKETYKFKVISEDFYGNRAESGIFTLETNKPFLSPYIKPNNTEEGVFKIALTKEFYRNEDDYIVIFYAERPVTISVGVKRFAKAKENVKGNSSYGAYSGFLPKDHPRLKKPADVNISTCYKCHQDIKKARSHPINIFPKPEMKVPPEYPLLPDGRISCITCHGKHGSNFEFRSLRSSKKELCIGCHTDY